MRGLIFIRHAVAEELDIAVENGIKDEERSLTKKGSKKMAQAAMGLKSIAPEIDYIATSPLLRATQTAEIIKKEYRNIELVSTDILQPGVDFNNFMDWARHLSEPRLIALVGHEPDLSHLLCWLLSGNQQSFLHFGKGGAGLMEFADNIEAGKGQLMWYLTPRQLRQIGETA